MTSGLTDAAKAEIKAAIAIIREDRFEAYIRSRTPKPVDPPKDDEILTDDKKGKKEEVIPPPAKDKEGDDNDPPQGRKSAYWGEIFE